MVQLSQQEIREKMAKILKDQMERPTLHPQNRSGGRPEPRTAESPLNQRLGAKPLDAVPHPVLSCTSFDPPP